MLGLESIPSEMVTGLVAGGMGAYIKMRAQDQANFVEIARLGFEQGKENNNSANDANKRGGENGAWIRRFIVICAIGTGFIGLFYMAVSDIPVTQTYTTQVKQHLFGLWSSGGKMKSIVTNGFTIPPYFSHSISAIIFFYFGSGAAKMSKRR